MRLTDEALLLRKVPYGESSLVVHALTPNHGRVHLVAKGAYRAKSGYCGVLDWFDTLRVTWTQRAGVELFALSAAEVRVRRPLTGDLVRYRNAHYAVELARLAARTGMRERGLFELVTTTLDRLVTEPGPHTVRLHFTLRYLRKLGLEPALAACASCGGDAPPVDEAGERVAFSAGAGGRLCESCARDARASGRRVGTLPRRALEAASVLLETGALPSGMSRPAKGELSDIVERFLEYHLETRPRSLATSTGHPG